MNVVEETINELIEISSKLSQCGVEYNTQRPIIELAENIYKKHGDNNEN